MTIDCRAPAAPLLDVDALHTAFAIDGACVPVVDGVSFAIQRGEVLGLVGESGCGKTVTALSVLGLVPPPGRITHGDVRFDGSSLLQLSAEEMRRVRGNDIAMIFQEPKTSLNPVLSCGEQIAEVLRTHRHLGRAATRRSTLEILERVGFAEPQRVARTYPHQLSGGMCQRVMIAMALCCSPSLLIADEPTTALDVTVQAQILELLGALQRSAAMAVLLIAHDLGVVAQLATRVAVMYAGRIVEQGPGDAVLTRPAHPYTRGLLRSLPRLDRRGARLQGIAGSVPSPLRRTRGCRFYDRCSFREDRCRSEDPPPRRVGAGHEACCLVDLPPWAPPAVDEPPV